MNMSHDSTILQSQIGQRLKQTYAVEILSRQLNPNPMPPLLKDIKNPRTLHLTCWFMFKRFQIDGPCNDEETEEYLSADEIYSLFAVFI